MSVVILVPATISHLEALRDDPDGFAELIAGPAPEGWPEFPEAVESTLARLADHQVDQHVLEAEFG